MKKRSLILFIASIILLVFASVAIAQAPVPSSVKKQTTAGNYVTAKQAYEMWKANPDDVKILDCRTAAEYDFLGHPEMAHNIPSSVWTGIWNPEKKNFVLKENPDFEAEAKKRFAADDTILIMCRSGNRSAASANRLTKAGFTKVYNIVDGFEGDKIKDEESHYHGKRMKNGWKNSGAPWTYHLNPKLVYAPQQ